MAVVYFVNGPSLTVANKLDLPLFAILAIFKPNTNASGYQESEQTHKQHSVVGLDDQREPTVILQPQTGHSCISRLPHGLVLQQPIDDATARHLGTSSSGVTEPFANIIDISIDHDRSLYLHSITACNAFPSS